MLIIGETETRNIVPLVSSGRLHKVVDRGKYRFAPPISMNAITVQRQLAISRLPSRIVSGIAHFSTNRQLLALARAPKVRQLELQRKREAQRQVPSRNPPPQVTSETTTIVELPKSLFEEAQVAGKLSVGWSEAQDILDEFDGTRLKSGSAGDLCLSEILVDIFSSRSLITARVQNRTICTYSTGQDTAFNTSPSQLPDHYRSTSCGY